MMRIKPEEIRNYLESQAEPQYREFASSLIPDAEKEQFLGVRLPVLRKLAKKLAKEDWRAYLSCASDDSFEEIMLQGMVIGCAKAELEEIQEQIRKFLPKIQNWSVCDSFCSSLKITKDYRKEMWEFIGPCLSSDQTYEIRFGVVMLICYYVEDVYFEEALAALERIRHESYYVKMAVAWAVSIYYLSYPEQVLAFLEKGTLDDFTYNKALQKICESKKVDEKTRTLMRSMKRKS